MTKALLCIILFTAYLLFRRVYGGISISQGLISLPRIDIEYDGVIHEMIQCDLTINEGNSGGALLNDKGKLIGITTFRLKDYAGNIIYGIAYCIPINAVMSYLNL